MKEETKNPWELVEECRYGELVRRIWGSGKLLWQRGEADYQGHCAVLVQEGGGWRAETRWVFYEWSWGSCSGCDGWEADGLSDSQVIAEMLKEAVSFATVDELEKYAKNLPDDKGTEDEWENRYNHTYGLKVAMLAEVERYRKEIAR